MKTIAYVRVSTDAQDVTHQRLAILEFARTERMAVDEFLEIQASSRHSSKVRQLEVLLDSLERGDTLIVSELSRLGRSVGEIITMVDRLVHQQIRVFALKEGLRLTGAQDLHSRVIVTLFGLFAEIERELLSKPRQNIVYLSAELNRLCRIRVSTCISIRDLSPASGLILPLYSVVAH
jgi:DNA invertase Pin-like site-specific DNA recombinase